MKQYIRLHKGREMVEKFLRLGVEIDKDIVKYAYYYDRRNVIDSFKQQNPNLFEDLQISENKYEGYLSTTKAPELLRESGASEISIAIRLEKRLAEIQELFRADSSGSALWQPDNFGTTALHEAAYYGRLDVLAWIRELELAGVEVDWNAQDSFLNTTLHNAIFADQSEAARALLEYGANPLLRNREDDTPVDYAIEAGFEVIGSAAYDEKSFDEYLKLLFDLAKTDEVVKHLIQICDYVICAFANSRENPAIEAILKGMRQSPGSLGDAGASGDATIDYAQAKPAAIADEPVKHDVEKVGDLADLS